MPFPFSHEWTLKGVLGSASNREDDARQTALLLPSRPELQTLQTCGYGEPDLALHTHRLQREGIVRTTNKHVPADAEANGGAGVGAGIRAGEVALREPRHRRKHVPCESGLLRDTDVETHFLDDGDITIFRHSLDAQHASEIGDGSNNKADAGAAAALEYSDLHTLHGLLRVGRAVRCNEHTRGDGSKDGRTAH